jgi:hypothetical protein
MSDMTEQGTAVAETGLRSSLPPALAAAVIPFGAPCERCRAAIPESYFVANGHVICPDCRRRLQGSMALALGFGLLAAIACSGLYYVVRAIWDSNFVLVAVLAGVCIGLSVRQGAQSSRATRYRVLSLMLTYACVASTYAAALIEMPGVDDALTAGVRALYLPALMLIGMKNPVTLLLLGFGLHEAWKLSAPALVNVDGPFLSAAAN